MFKSDKQRRAAFRNMFSNSNNSFPSTDILYSKPKYVYDGDYINSFSKEDDIKAKKRMIDSLDRAEKKVKDPSLKGKIEAIKNTMQVSLDDLEWKKSKEDEDYLLYTYNDNSSDDKRKKILRNKVPVTYEELEEMNRLFPRERFEDPQITEEENEEYIRLLTSPETIDVRRKIRFLRDLNN